MASITRLGQYGGPAAVWAGSAYADYGEGPPAPAGGSGTGAHGSGGYGSQTAGTVRTLSRRSGRRGHLVNPWTWWRNRGALR